MKTVMFNNFKSRIFRDFFVNINKFPKFAKKMNLKSIFYENAVLIIHKLKNHQTMQSHPSIDK